MSQETKHTPLMDTLAAYGEMIAEIIVGIVNVGSHALGALSHHQGAMSTETLGILAFTAFGVATALAAEGNGQ